ncbi:hypothetical protein BS78_06G213500 [Paspalum vaginatum]|nr:hypothetical protein BS78_06G213500 [Paspalum vaginatum]
MDFLALPRRELQALCKRNGVRANMTNAAMADALRALPTVDGIEEYIKPPVAVPEPVVTAVAEEEPQKLEKQGCQLPRGRRATAKPSEPIKPDEGKEEEKGDAMRQSNKENAVVGRRGASRRARAAPAVAEPTGKAEEEQRAPNSRACCVKSKPAELICLDDSEKEEKENTKPEKEDDAPAIGVGRRGGSHRAPAHVEAPATRRTGATGKTEARDVVMEAVPIRPTRQRKLTMKAAAAAEDKAPRRATRRGAVRKTLLQHEGQEEPQLLQHEEQEEPQGAVSIAEAVSAPVSDQGCDDSEDLEQACSPQNEDLNEAVHASKQDKDVVINQDEVLMEENPEEELLVTDQECTDRSTLQEHLVDVEKYPAPLASQEDSPILGLVSVSTGQSADEDEGANFLDSIGYNEGLLGKRVSEEVCDAVEEMEMVPVVQLLQATLIAEESTEEVIAGEASHKKEISEVGAENDIVSRQKDDLVDEAIFRDCSGNISQIAGEMTNEVNDEDGFGCQNKGDVVADKVLPDTVDEAIILEMEEEAGNITCEMTESPAALDSDGEETTFYANKQDEEVIIGDGMSQITMIDTKAVQEEKVGLITDELPLGTAAKPAMHDYIEGDHSEAAFGLGDELITADNLPEVKMADCGIVEEENPLIVDEKQHDIATMVYGVVDHFETDVVRANELMEVATTEEVPELTGADGEVVGEKKTPVIVDEPQRTVTMDEDVVKDNLETDIVHADEHMEMVTTDEVPEFTRTDGEVVGEKKTPLADYEKQQIMVTISGDVDDHFKNDVAHADEPKEVITSELVEEEKATVITVDMRNIIHTVDVCVKESHFGHGNEEKKAITSDIVAEVSRTEDSDDLKDNALTSHLPHELNVAEDSNGRIAPAMIDDLTESKSIVTVEPSVLTAEDTSVCKSSSEKNTTEPMAVQEEKGVKVVKISVDLTGLSLGQLRAKLKKKLNAKKNKEAKRVALARVDENICRSHAKGRQLNPNLQQH